MIEFFDGLDVWQKAFWYIALPTSIFFLLQTILTFLGFGGSDVDLDSSEGSGSGDTPFEFFTLRNLINFLLGFSWSGISFYDSISNKFILLIVAIFIGITFVGLFFILIKQILKLSEDNSFQYKDTLNKTAKVYLSIPENKTGTGKVQLSIKGSSRELEAITHGAEKIPTGALVIVKKVENNILIVEKI